MKHKIYTRIFAHRGFHLKYPENTMEAYLCAVKQKMSNEIDVRILKCGTLICFHDRYTSRLLSVPGKTTNQTYEKIQKMKVLGTKYKVPKFNDVLTAIDGKSAILIEVKGYMSKRFKDSLKESLKGYEGEIYFHSRNFLTYLKCKRIWKENVFFIPNIFRKRFQFLKGKHYKRIYSVPTIDDILVEAEDNVKTLVKKISKTFNIYTTRVKDDHFLLSYNGKKYQIQHRAIVNHHYREHSEKAFRECVKRNKVIEFDVMKYGDRLICYHSDRGSDKLGQKKSIAEKLDIKKSLTFEKVLEIVNGEVPIIVDVKDFSFFDRSLEEKIMKGLESYTGQYVIQSFNPLVLIYLMKKYPLVIRGQVGNSLKGLKKTRNILLTIINPLLFYNGRPDYIIFDLDSIVKKLARFNNIIGLPVIAYTAQSKEDLEEYKDSFDNIMVEQDF